MQNANEPLGSRLRHAAIDRTMTESERVDDFVLDPDGVIDLRQLQNDPLVGSIADPAPALRDLRGKLGSAEISDLYDESEMPKPRWRLGLRARHAYGDRVASVPATTTTEAPPDTAPLPEPPKPIGQLSKVSLSPEFTSKMTTSQADDGIENRTVEHTDTTASQSADIDLRNDDRPTANCPKCAGLAHRDLFDRFSQVEFYSCDRCSHMWQQDVSQ